MKKLLIISLMYLTACVPPPDKPTDTPAPEDTTLPGVGFQIDSLLFPSEAGAMFGMAPKDSALADKRFAKLKYLRLLPELLPSKVARYKVLHPQDYNSWEEAGLNNTAIDQFLLTPGDYTMWGGLVPLRSGTKDNPIIIRYFDPHLDKPYQSDHPVKLKDRNREAVIEGFKLSGVDNIILHGITVRGVTGGKDVDGNWVTGGMKNTVVNCSNIAIDFCLLENLTSLGIRIVNGSDCAVQCCVFRQLDKRLNGDGGAIGISATKGRSSANNRIIANEIKNFNDGIGFPREGTEGGTGEDSMTGDVPGTVIEGNDIYIDTSLYVVRNGVTYACAENALDFKNGTKTANGIQVIGNRLWGFRPSDPSCGPSGSNGPAITLHRAASNISITNNFIFDCPIGVSVLGQDKKFPGESMSGLVVRNNLLFGFVKDGTGFQVANSVTIQNNTVVGARYGVVLNNAKAAPVFSKNLFINCGDLNGGRLPGSNVWRAGVPGREVTVYVKRWTGVEKRLTYIF